MPCCDDDDDVCVGRVGVICSLKKDVMALRRHGVDNEESMQCVTINLSCLLSSHIDDERLCSWLCERGIVNVMVWKLCESVVSQR